MLKAFKTALASFSILLFAITAARAQNPSCGVSSDDLNVVLDSRSGRGSDYSQSITSGIAFILHEECDSALVYFRSAFQLDPTPAVEKTISALEEYIGRSVQQPPSDLSTQTSVKQSDSNPVAANPTSVPAVESPIIEETSTTQPQKKSFSSQDMASFQAKGLAKIKRLTEYLNIISDRSTPMNTAMSTVESALSLFDSEEHTVEVSSVNRDDKSRFPVRTYFNRLRMLNYSKVVIEGAAFTYVSSFRKGPDGYYYGIARFRQAFTGFKDNKPVYSDITTKTVSVVLKPYQKAMDGESSENWDVFLGDISVTQTQR